MKKSMILLFLIVFTFSSISTFSQISLDSLKEKNLPMYGFVKEWLGVKYKVGGNTKNGIDCSGFSKKLYETLFNINIPRTAQLQYKFTDRVPKNELCTGDLVFFKTKTRTTWHVGIYITNGFFIHSANHKTGVKINSLYEDYYMRTYLSGGRII